MRSPTSTGSRPHPPPGVSARSPAGECSCHRSACCRRCGSSASTRPRQAPTAISARRRTRSARCSTATSSSSSAASSRSCCTRRARAPMRSPRRHASRSTSARPVRRSSISAVVVDLDWSPRRVLSRDEWGRVFDGLARVDEIAAEHEPDPRRASALGDADRAAERRRGACSRGVTSVLPRHRPPGARRDRSGRARRRSRTARGPRAHEGHRRSDRRAPASERARPRARCEGGALQAARRRRRADRRDRARARGSGLRRLVRARAGHLASPRPIPLPARARLRTCAEAGRISSGCSRTAPRADQRLRAARAALRGCRDDRHPP